MTRVTTAVGDLHVEELGTRGRPAVLLWHSFLHHGGMWKAQAHALAPAFHVLSIDAPGHGRSAKLTRAIHMDECADAACAVLDAHGVGAASFVGLSWGGMVALAAAIRHPERVRSMALFDTSGRAEPRWKRAEYALLARIAGTVGIIPPLVDRIEPLMFAQQTRRHDRVLVDEWRAYVARCDVPSILHSLRCIMGRPDRSAAMPAIRVPTLVVVGSQDRAQPPDESRFIAAQIPGARLAVIPDAGHLSAIEVPDQATALIHELLAVSTPPAG